MNYQTIKEKPLKGYLHVIVKPLLERSAVSLKKKYEPEEPDPIWIPKDSNIPEATRILGTNLFETKRKNNNIIRFPNSSDFYDFRTSNGMIFVDKTPYIERLEKTEEDFQFIFLRPQDFGKSTFLNMMCIYYDIYYKDSFDDLFGPLYIGRNPTRSRSKHLVMKFDLSHISIDGSFDQMKESFDTYININLASFVHKYWKELKDPQIDAVIDTKDASISLRKFWDVYVQLRGMYGFTDLEVKALVQHYLRKNKQEADEIVHSMKMLYNGYYFCNIAYNKLDTPQ